MKGIQSQPELRSVLWKPSAPPPCLFWNSGFLGHAEGQCFRERNRVLKTLGIVGLLVSRVFALFFIFFIFFVVVVVVVVVVLTFKTSDLTLVPHRHSPHRETLPSPFWFSRPPFLNLIF